MSKQMTNVWDLFSPAECEQINEARAAWLEREISKAHEAGKILIPDETYRAFSPRAAAVVAKNQIKAAGLPDLAARINPEDFQANALGA